MLEFKLGCYTTSRGYKITQTKPRSAGTIEARPPSCPVDKLLPKINFNYFMKQK